MEVKRYNVALNFNWLADTIVIKRLIQCSFHLNP